MKNKILILVFFFVYCSFINVQAEEKSNSFSIDIGESWDEISIYRFGLQREFSGWLEKRGIPLSGYFESSLNYWKGVENEIYGIAFSPVFGFQLCNDCKYKPYIEAGVGASLISNTEIDDRNLSSSFQFENRVGFGVTVDNIDVHIRYMHYSNAGLSKPNNGIDIYLVGVAFLIPSRRLKSILLR